MDAYAFSKLTSWRLPLLVTESHSDASPSLRITDSPPIARYYPADCGYVPYVLILVRALQDCKESVRDIPVPLL